MRRSPSPPGGRSSAKTSACSTSMTGVTTMTCDKSGSTFSSSFSPHSPTSLLFHIQQQQQDSHEYTSVPSAYGDLAYPPRHVTSSPHALNYNLNANPNNSVAHNNVAVSPLPPEHGASAATATRPSCSSHHPSRIQSALSVVHKGSLSVSFLFEAFRFSLISHCLFCLGLSACMFFEISDCQCTWLVP